MFKKFQLSLTSLVVGGLILSGVGFEGGRHWIEIRQLVLHQKTISTQPDFSGLGDLYATLLDKYDGNIDAAKISEGVKQGLVAAAGDPYTVYLNAKAAKALEDDLNGTLSGIGAEVGIKNNKLIIVAPINDAPAAKAGLKSGDQIIKIDSQDTSGLTLDEAVSKIRGPEGTKVKITFIRGTQPAADITITRASITVPSIKSSMKPGNIGYIQVSAFGTDTADKFSQAAADLVGKGAKSIIIDLRNNPGGYLDAAVRMTSEFTNTGIIVEERKGTKSIEKLNAKSGGHLIGAKTVVLINGGSASASEIMAGAMQDRHLATIVGEQSFGKGSVQEIQKLDDGAELKVTIAHWYTPNGKNIGKAGITPDTVVKLTQDDYEHNRDPQLDKALEILSH